MTSGKRHDEIGLFCTPIVTMVTYYYTQSLEFSSIVFGSHLIGILYLSPDLDLVSRPFKRWGLLKFLWVPYQKMIPCHRHWLSHAPLIGSTVRLIYLSILIACFSFMVFYGSQIAGYPIEIDKEVIETYVTTNNLLAVFIGIEVSAINHIFLDGMILPFPRFIKNFLK